MINSGYFENIYFEYSIDATLLVRRSIVLLEGIPTTSKKDNIIFDLQKLGFDIFYPQYEGTRASKGTFLSRSPVESIEEFIKSIHNGILLREQFYSSNSIYIIGSSFGGGITLSLKNTPYIKKCIALSPVISFKLVKGIKTLESYISSNLSELYRYSKEDWNKMLNDGIFSPIKNTNLPSEKTMIIAGTQDPEIDVLDLKDFSSKRNIKFIPLDNRGHITLSKIDHKILTEIGIFFNN